MNTKNKIISGLNLILSLFILTITSCQSEKHFLNEPAYRKTVHQQYLKRLELARGRESELFSVMKQKLTTEEREALEFLFAFMPLSDLANLDGQYFLNQVRLAFQARDFFSWGKNIPEDIFRHFVLPYRVNNENPDEARGVFLEELKERIQNLSMYQAALEVNHWCHEKVTYHPTDERTSAPLATVKTAFGRCGEESTFTVAALRAVSIPARQVYTPRWAHTDDNHAWVEVWVDGRWYYLGACEPEPELNMAWFTGPAKRAMLVHTTVFGQYQGPEETILKTDLYTKINQLPIYAPTSVLKVEVVDEKGQPRPGVKVDFCIYNYAEFYPVVTRITDEKGQATLLTGLGDMYVQAYQDNLFAWTKVSVGTTDKVTLVLKPADFTERIVDLDIIPPVVRTVDTVDRTKSEENLRRLKQEDEIRSKYEATFIKQEQAESLARDKNLPAELTWKYLKLSRGNWPEILEYLKALRPEETVVGLGLLGAISEKDLRDTPASYLLHHLRNAPAKDDSIDNETYVQYVVSPRIGRELITPWRNFINQFFNEKQKTEFKEQPEKIVRWLEANLKLDWSENYYNVPLFPEGALKLGLADLYSQKILFVAIARTLGVPARIDRTTGRVNYYKDGKWREILFLADEEGQEKQEKMGKARLRLIYQPTPEIKLPVYYTHFTLARFSHGKYQTLDYENDSAFSSFPTEIEVDAGQYLLLTGNRQSDGSVLARLYFFSLPAGKTQEIKFTLRTETQPPAALGQLILNGTAYDLRQKTTFNLTGPSGKQSLILLLIDPEKEPSKHLLNEIKQFKEQFASWPGLMLIVVAKDRLPAGFQTESFSALPETAKLLYDESDDVRKLISSVPSSSGNLPAVLAIRNNGQIIFFSEGYHIGTAEQLIKCFRWLR
ncbi:MAG: transglutaminase domain-containing protein [Candidatus Aminicenantes bacterium]|nr:transglutaminase domain-containing protein [Candidatus Aminicenantes bacterium]